MNPEELAKQLRKPEGELGAQVAGMMHKGNATFYQKLGSIANFQKDDDVLEVGMGGGLHLNAMLKDFPVHSYMGLDYSVDMVALASKNIEQQEGLNVEFQCADAASSGLESESKSLIFTINTVYFYSDIDKVIQEYYRILKPEGRLLIGFRIKEDLEKMRAVTDHNFNKYDFSDLRAVMTNAGFEVREEYLFNDPNVEFDGIPLKLRSAFLLVQKPA